MKRGLSRGEWLLITAPLIGFVIFAAAYTRWKATAPATLSPSPVPLYTVLPAHDGHSVFALGEEIDSLNVRQPGTPWHFLRWNMKDGSLDSHFTEFRSFRSWVLSRDGKLLAYYFAGKFNRNTKKYGAGTITIRRTDDGSEVASWSAPSVSGYSVHLIFSLDSRELLTLNERLERHDIATGKVLGGVNASQLFSKDSRFRRLKFSPDGRSVVVVEDSLYLYSPRVDEPSATTTAPISGELGGRLAVLSYPDLRLQFRPRGNIYSDCSWESNKQFWAIATLKAGYEIQRLVRARIETDTRKTAFDELELPTKVAPWIPESLAVNGTTGQVMFADLSNIVVWGRDGQLKTTFSFAKPDVPKGGNSPPGTNSPPRFSSDGRFIYRGNDTNIERYDLSRFLPASSPVQAQTASP